MGEDWKHLDAKTKSKYEEANQKALTAWHHESELFRKKNGIVLKKDEPKKIRAIRASSVTTEKKGKKTGNFQL